jgi:hypothetical protein
MWYTSNMLDKFVLSGVATGQVAYKRITGNLQGDVLVLSVNRAPYTDGTRVNGVSNIVRTAQDCEDQCTFTSGCQGWTFCNKPGGCGGGCRAYHAKNGPGELPGHGHGTTPPLHPAVYIRVWAIPVIQKSNNRDTAVHAPCLFPMTHALQALLVAAIAAVDPDYHVLQPPHDTGRHTPASESAYMPGAVHL